MIRTLHKDGKHGQELLEELVVNSWYRMSELEKDCGDNYGMRVLLFSFVFEVLLLMQPIVISDEKQIYVDDAEKMTICTAQRDSMQNQESDMEYLF